MLTLNECRKLVDPKKEKYTDEQLQKKLDFLKELASIIVNDIKQENDEKASCVDVARIKR
jgi:hypothetical protein